MTPDPPVRSDNLCACGCGFLAPIATRTDTRKGWRKGQPMRFLAGHFARTPENREHGRRLGVANRGRPLTVETRAKISQSVRGERNHNWNPEADPHPWIHRNWVRAGSCEECGRTGKTDFSFQKHPLNYTRDRRDYRELCRSCHMRFDAELGIRPRGRA